MSDDTVTILGETNWRNTHTRFGIKRGDRRGHMLLLGKTGVGKSTLLANIIVSDMRAGAGVAVLDPHGALIEEIVLDHIPDHRVDDVIYINPMDHERVVPFNPLERVDSAYHHLVASGIISIFKKIWGDTWGPRLEHVLRYALLTLLASPGSTLLDMARLLMDELFRKQLVTSLNDPHLKTFWRKEFDAYSPLFRGEASAPILNKVGAFTGNPLLRSMIGQSENTFDFRTAMDQGKILLVNLAKGRMGEDASALLGAMVMTKLWLAALSRQDVPESERRDFFLAVDEAHSITGSFADMLSETRKYRLSTTLALQYLEQLNPAFRAALLGNVGTLMAFRTGAEDAAYLAREFYPIVREVDFVNLPKYHMYLKLLIDGVPSQGFSAQTVALVPTPTGNKAKVIESSRNRYGRSAPEFQPHQPRIPDTAARWQKSAPER